MADATFLDSVSPEFNKQILQAKDNIILTTKEMRELVSLAKGIKFPSQLSEFSQKAETSIKKTNDALTQNNKIVEKARAAELKLQKQRESQINKESQLRQRLLAQRKREEAATAKSIESAKKEALAQQKAAAISKELGRAFNVATRKRNELAKIINDLNVKRSLGTKLTQKETALLARSERAFNKYNAAVNNASRHVGRFHDNVGNYPKAMMSAARAARSLAGALGLVGGAFLAVSAVRNAIGVIRDYEKSNATLAAVLQKTKEETIELREESQRLGATTVKTASEVTGLQIEYARLGFQQQEIIDLTAATIDGSIAMNSELSSTAQLVGAVVNTFDDLTTTDAPKIIDILSLATAKSALNFSKLETGIPIVAGAANAAGIPFTKLVALMGKLADSGIDVSTSSTALRNIFIESAAQGLNYEQILEKIKGSQDKLTAANDEFGKRAAVSSAILAKNIDSTKELDEALQNAAGTAKEMAEKELNTLDGALKLLRSSWEGVILGTDEAGGITEKLTGVIRYLAEHLNDIVSTIGTVVKGFLLYKAVLIAINIVKRAATAYIIAYRVATIAMNKGILSTVKNLKFLRAALINTGIGAAVVAVGALVYAFSGLNKSIAETAKEMHEANEEFIQGGQSTVNLNAALGKAADRYDELKKQTELSVEEQKEMDKIIKLIAKNAPKTAQEIDEYGNTIGVVTEKVREFNKASNQEVLVEANSKLKAQSKILKELQKESQIYTDIFQKGHVKTVEGIGRVFKEGNTLFKNEKKWNSAHKEFHIKKIALTDAEVTLITSRAKLVRENINLTKKDIETNEELIGTITGEWTERQIVNKVKEIEAKADAKSIKTKEDQVLIVKKLRKEIADLKNSLRSLTKDGYENLTQAQADEIKKTRDSITAKEKELNAILGVTKAKGKSAKESREKVKAYQAETESHRNTNEALKEQIDLWTKIRDKVTIGSEAYKFADDMIKSLTVSSEGLGDEGLKGLEKYKEGIDNSAKVLKKYKEDIKSFLDTFSGDFISNTGLGTTFDILNGNITGFGENAAVTFNAIAESAQEAFNFINQASNDSFNSQIEDLRQQKEIALLFAGESTAARERIEEQFTEKQKQIENERAKKQKDIALFNIAIDTAQAIVSALPNIPLSIAVGAIGFAQAAFVASKDIPQFKHGHLEGTHSGLALVNDGGRDEFLERRGQVHRITGRNVLLDMKEGDKIHKSESSMISHFNKELDNELLKNNIYASAPTINPQIKVVNQGITKGEMQTVMDSSFRKYNSTVVWDKKGMNEYNVYGIKKAKSLNNKVVFRGKNV